MNYQRLTISMPATTYNDVVNLAGKGKVSGYITRAVKSMVLEEKLMPADPVEAFLSHREKLPKLTNKEIMAAIRKGRM